MARAYAILAVVVCLASTGAWAQNVGTVVGTVKDHTGAVMAGVSVKATNDLTGIEHSATTNDSGDYTLLNLPQGVYTFTITAKAFREQKIEGIEVHVGSTVRQDATLALATVSAQVEVVASTPLVNSETSEIGILTYSEQIRSLPLNGRSVYNLLFITAGTNSDDANNNQNKPSVAGGRPGYAVFRIDGVDVNGHNTVSGLLEPSADAVEEFRAETQMAPASETSSSNIQVAIKSGSNQFHGTAFEFFRNNKLDAHQFFERQISGPGYSYVPNQLRYNQFGGTLGGPIRKDKTFFFASYEGTRNYSKTQVTMSQPTAAMLAGDFTGVNPVSGAAMKLFGNIMDPKSKLAFPGNQIPADRVNSFAKKFNAYLLPANCMECLAGGLGFDFVGTGPGYVTPTSVIGRIDHRFSSSDSVAGSVDIRDAPSSNYNHPVEISRFRLNNRATLVTVSETHIFTPALLNEFRGGFLRRAGRTRQQGDANGEFTFQNTPFSNPSIDPTVLIGGYTTAGNGRLSSDTRAVEDGANFLDNVSYTRGEHQIKVGMEYRRTHAFNSTNYNAVFAFVDNLPPLYGFTTNGFADYLLGLPAQALTAQGIGRDCLLKRSHYGVFLQDDWKVAPRLTLNLGLRWEYAQRWYNNDPMVSRLSTLDLGPESKAVGGRFLLAGSPNYYIPGKGIITGSGAPLIRESVIDPAWKDFMPRVGFAFRPFNNNRTAIRGGFGVYFAIPDSSSILSMSASPPYYFVSTYTNLPATRTVDQFFPLPGAGQAGSASADPRLRDPRMYQWTFTVQQQVFSKMMVAVEYLGNRGLKLPFTIQANEAPFPNATQLAVLKANPALNTTLAQQRAPFPGIPLGFALTSSVANSWYNALNVRMEGRFSNRLTFSSIYTWSKVLDQSSYENTGAPTTTTNLRLNKSYADFDRPHRLVASWVYMLPFGNQIWKPSNAALRKVIDGWEFTGISTFQAGGPYSISMGADTSFRGGALPVFPNFSGPLVYSDIRTSNGIYLTPTNFSPPVLGTLGGLARNAFHGPGINNFDLGFLKNVIVRERLRVQFRSEMFNAFNHAQFAFGGSSLLRGIASPAPGTTEPVLQYTDPSNFGRVGARSARVIQFALKLIW
ncbi:MAG: TonB-dependent receptor [Bryobacteraceae bacterium]